MTLDPFEPILITAWLGLAGVGLYWAFNAPAQVDPPEQSATETSP